MNRPLHIGGYVVRVRSGHISRRQALWSASLERDTMEVVLRGIVMRRQKVQASPLCRRWLRRGRCQKAALVTGSILSPDRETKIGMLPAVAFAEPNDLLVFVEPTKVVVVFHPGVIRFDQNCSDFPRRGIGQHKTVGVLQAVAPRIGTLSRNVRGLSKSNIQGNGYGIRAPARRSGCRRRPGR